MIFLFFWGNGAHIEASMDLYISNPKDVTGNSKLQVNRDDTVKTHKTQKSIR